MSSYDQTGSEFGLQEVPRLYKSYLDKFRIKNHKVVYHYTNLKGLKGILSSRQLWFTNYEYLNDPSEIKHSIEVVKNQINSRSDFDRRVLMPFLTELKLALKSYTIGAFSFCNEKDYLHAWQSYADDGVGVTIGIRPGSIDKSWKENNHQEETCWVFDNYQIDYEHKFFKILVTKYLNCLLKRLQIIDSTKNKWIALNNIGKYMVCSLLTLLPQCKHEAYKGEHEYRFVMIEKNPLKPKVFNPNPKPNERGYFLKHNSGENNQFVNLIPTIISENFDKDIIVEIGIGPACNQEQVEYEVRSFLQQKGFDSKKVEIYKSSIPYRGNKAFNKRL